MNFEASDRIKFAASVLAAAILSSGLTLGLYKVGGGLAARAGNAITAFYGGTGYTNYTKGDILVGAGSTFIILQPGSNDQVLRAFQKEKHSARSSGTGVFSAAERSRKELVQAQELF